MNHKTEKHEFKVGDLVFQDLDAKRESMLIKVVGIHKNGLYKCTYVYHNEYLKKRMGWNKKVFLNGGGWLHDASLWGIDSKNYKKIIGKGANFFHMMDRLNLEVKEK